MSFIIRNLYLVNVIYRRNLLHFQHSRHFYNINKTQAIFSNKCALTSSRTMTQACLKSIGIKELRNYQQNGTLIIDVREMDEVTETGILPGGIHIPLANVAKALCATPEEFEVKYGRKKPEKVTDIVFSCRSGRRSALACQQAAELGFVSILNFEGGWLEWEKQGKK